MPRHFDPPQFQPANSSTGHSGTTHRQVFSVSDLNRQAKQLLEVSFPAVWVEGELSNLARPNSGHWYFTLKDSKAQVRCAMFRGSNIKVRLQPNEGMQVLIRARVSLYEGRGDYQLIAEHMEEAGAGALQKAFEQLKNRLAAEGLFAEEHKQPLPKMPTHIAVVTSPSGAAIRDILTVFRRRFPALAITIFPTMVQGNEAAPQIVKALQQAQQLNNVDAIIVGRGGGSIEDLWPFNEESVARAIYACQIPVVSAVGHEVDFTIADFVADHRAPTPSAAAEILSPNQIELHNTLLGYQQRLAHLIQQRLVREAQHLQHLSNRLRHPGERLREQGQRLDDLEIRLRQAMRQNLQQASLRLAQQQSQLSQHNPASTLRQINTLQQQLAERLAQAMRANLKQLQQTLAAKAGELDAYSPLATLHRGYSITSTPDGHIITRSDQLADGDIIETRLSQGVVNSRVLSH